MGIYLNHNSASVNALRNLNTVSAQLSKSMERLSSGYKINRAADSPSGLLVSNTLQAQIRGSQAAMSNVQLGNSMLATVDGAMQASYGVLQRIREIAVLASNGTAGSSYNAEYVQLRTQLDAISNTATYNNQNILDGSLSAAAYNIQIGANTGAANVLDIRSAFSDIDAAALGVAQAAMTDATMAGTVLGQVTTAMNSLNAHMARVGRYQNQLNDASSTLSIAIENLSAADASVRSTDIATETATLARLQILQQAAASALSQANTIPSIALRLLG